MAFCLSFSLLPPPSCKLPPARPIAQIVFPHIDFSFEPSPADNNHWRLHLTIGDNSTSRPFSSQLTAGLCRLSPPSPPPQTPPSFLTGSNLRLLAVSGFWQLAHRRPVVPVARLVLSHPPWPIHVHQCVVSTWVPLVSPCLHPRPLAHAHVKIHDLAQLIESCPAT